VPVFVAAAALMAAVGVAVLRLGDRPYAAHAAAARPRGGGFRAALPFIAVGLIGALAFATENAHQSWSAIFLADELGASAGLAAIAPATFAVFAALTRFAAGVFTRIPSGALLGAGAAVALVGTLVIAAAQQLPVALVGLALAAIGTSVLFPTLLSRATRDVPAPQRGRATSAVATTSYLGFLLGPVYVGLIADAAGLGGAVVAGALLAAVFAVLAPAVTRGSARTAAGIRTHT
jgi:fucose permease